jgi:hypothetical protein
MKPWVLLLAVVSPLALVSACEQDPPPLPAESEPAAAASVPPPTAPEPPTPKDPLATLVTEEDLEEEAAELISEDNLQQRLAEVERELESDPAP